MKSFQEKVIDVVKAIPKGSVLTYRDVASRASGPLAVRAVGSVLAKNKDITVPCHRVIKSDGRVGAYNGLKGESKQEILEKEGVVFGEKGKIAI